MAQGWSPQADGGRVRVQVLVNSCELLGRLSKSGPQRAVSG